MERNPEKKNAKTAVAETYDDLPPRPVKLDEKKAREIFGGATTAVKSTKTSA